MEKNLDVLVQYLLGEFSHGTLIKWIDQPEFSAPTTIPVSKNYGKDLGLLKKADEIAELTEKTVSISFIIK